MPGPSSLLRRRQLLGALGIAALGLPLAGPARAVQTAAKSTRGIEAVSLDEALALHAEGVLFIDTRTPEEFAEGCIPHALNVALPRFQQVWLRELVHDDRPFVVYSTDDRCRRGPLCAIRAAAYGYTHVAVFRGGLGGWRQAGLEVEIPAA